MDTNNSNFEEEKMEEDIGEINYDGNKENK